MTRTEPNPPVRTKICGLTRPEEAIACLQAGADWIGLNFHPSSSRFVSHAQAREILDAVGDASRVVALFVNRPTDEVGATADALGIQIVQLHGDEPPGDLLTLGRFQLIRAFRLGSAADIDAMERYRQDARRMGREPDAVLVDAFVEGQAGGTGKSLDDSILGRIPPLPRLILAGGLTPENVAERAERARPWMVDVASGVESSPGRKDPAKVAHFIRASRGGDPAVDIRNPRL